MGSLGEVDWVALRETIRHLLFECHLTSPEIAGALSYKWQHDAVYKALRMMREDGVIERASNREAWSLKTPS